MINFRDKYLPVFQAPETPTSPAPSAASGSGTPSTPSAPTSTPSASAATPSGPPAASSPTANDSPPSAGADLSSFEFMFGPEGGDPLEGPGLSPPTTATPTTTPVQPTPAKPETPAVTTPEPGVPPTTATPAPTEATSPTTATEPQPNLDPYDPGTLAAHLAQNEEQVVQHIADNIFKLSDKDVEELESNAVQTIPKLLARGAVFAQKNFLMQIASLVPRMIQTYGEVTKRHTEAEGEFYTRWPDIKKDQSITVAGKPTTVGSLVMQYAAVYRQMNPQASRKDAIEAVGPMVMMAAGVTPSVPGQTAQVPGGPVPSPMANGTRPPQSSPFVPAGPTAGGAVPTTKPELSPVEAMFLADQ